MKRSKAKKVIQKAWTVKDVISNAIWFLLGGLWIGLIFGLAGLLLCVTVVGIPLGKQCFRAAFTSMFPYGKRVSLHPSRHPVANTVWAILVGWELALIFFVSGVLCILAVLTFFRGLQAFKLARLAFLPFGAETHSLNHTPPIFRNLGRRD